MPRVFPTGHRHRGAGLTVADQPSLERAMILARHFGNTWYVNSAVAGGVAGSGDSWGSSFLTLQAAISAASAYDTILVAPTHAENISAAGSVTVSKALTIVGVGTGRGRPTFTWTATAGTFLVTAANVYIENCVFLGIGIDAVVTMFNVSASDCTMVGNEIEFARTSLVCLLGITITGTVNRFRFYHNNCHGAAAANCTNFVQIAGGGDSHEFVGNMIIGNFTTTLGCINNITTLCSRILIVDNLFVNATASATKVVVMLTGSSGIIANNRVGIGSGAAPFTIGSGHWCGNWSAAAVATDGTLV